MTEPKFTPEQMAAFFAEQDTDETTSQVLEMLLKQAADLEALGVPLANIASAFMLVGMHTNARLIGPGLPEFMRDLADNVEGMNSKPPRFNA